MYKLIAIDIDGTLINSQGEISPRVNEAIRAAQARGVKVVLVTGRPIGGVANYVKELGLDEEDDFVVTYNGAFVQNTHTGEVMQENFLSYDDLEDLFALSKEIKTPMHYFDINYIYTPNKEINHYTVYESYVNDIPLVYQPLEEVTKDISIPKVMFIDKPERLDETIAAIPNAVKEKYTMLRSAPYFLEILHPQVSKGLVLEQLANDLGIEREAVISIGDGGNDISMIDFAGCGVAMENAVEEVKAVADFHTKSNDADGVAYAIEQLVLRDE